MGVENGVFRLTFLVSYFGLIMLNMGHFRGMPEPSLGSLIGLHIFWALLAIHLAVHTNKSVCAMVNERRERDYLRARARAEDAMPVSHYKNIPGTREFEPVRRPLLDPQMGLTARR